MLNGTYPVIVIQKINAAGKPGKSVPVYLDEQLTGIAIESQNRRTEFANDPVVGVSSDNTENPEIAVKQRGVSNGVDIVLKASRNSIGMNLLLPLADVAFENATTGKYLISYFNQNVILFRAKLGHFSTDENSSNTSVTINISLEKEDKSDDEDKQTALPNNGNAYRPFAN